MRLCNEGNVCLVFQSLNHLLTYRVSQRPHEGGQIGFRLVVRETGLIQKCIGRVLINEWKWNVPCTGAKDQSLFRKR